VRAPLNELRGEDHGSCEVGARIEVPGRRRPGALSLFFGVRKMPSFIVNFNMFSITR
jgi:hypothetical protein